MKGSSPTPVVFEAGVPRPVTYGAATPADLAAVGRWSRLGGNDSGAGADALEFAAMARKRWKTFRQLDRIAASATEAKARVSADSKCEVAFFGVVRADWFTPSRVIGLTLSRRTWHNRICLDFLATHPLIATQAVPVNGTATVLLFQVAELADALGADVLWGETTVTSAPVYQHWFQLPTVEDLLWVPRSHLRDFCRKTRDRWQQNSVAR